MTVETLDAVKALVIECTELGRPVVAVFKYIHNITGKTLYAVFLDERHIDIFESPYVDETELIYADGKWVHGCSYLNG